MRFYLLIIKLKKKLSHYIRNIIIYAYIISHFSNVRLFGTLWTLLPGSSVHGFLKAKGSGVGC